MMVKVGLNSITSGKREDLQVEIDLEQKPASLVDPKTIENNSSGDFSKGNGHEI